MLLHQLDTRNREESIDSEVLVDEPIFELVTEWRARTSAGADDETTPSASSLIRLSHTKHIKLYSTAIINALQTVVKYYPSQDLSGSPVTIQYPFAILAHHYDELAAFRRACEAMKPSEMCEREVHASSHLTLLLRFLDDTIMGEVRLEQERNRNGTRTWDMMWVGFKPGSTRLERFLNHKDYQARIVESVTGGTFENPPSPWIVQTWSLDFDGDYVGRVSNSFQHNKFDGEELLENVWIWSSAGEFLDAVENEELAEEVKKQIDYGKIWWNLLHKACKNYRGKSRDYPHNEVSEWERNESLLFSVPPSVHPHVLLNQDTILRRNKTPLTPSLCYYFRWTGLLWSTWKAPTVRRRASSRTPTAVTLSPTVFAACVESATKSGTKRC